MQFDNNGMLHLRGLSVVNGCQSLNTILSCSERVKTLDDSYIMFRFYEIPERDRSDKISVSTNLAGIRAAIKLYFNILPSMPGGNNLKQQLDTSLSMNTSDFEARWAAD